MTLTLTFDRFILGILVWTKLVLGQIEQATPWADVCTDAAYQQYVPDLCPDTFIVSTLAFNPFYPKADTNITMIIQPTVDMPGSVEMRQYVDLILPGFSPLGTVNFVSSTLRDLRVNGSNPVVVGQNPATSYNTYLNPIFQDPASYDTTTGILRMEVSIGKTLFKGIDTEVMICCMSLPPSSPLDNPALTIGAPMQGRLPKIQYGEVSKTPYLDPGLQWQFLMVTFTPPVSLVTTTIDLTIQPASALGNRARIILSLPRITRSITSTIYVEFNTRNSGNSSDWIFFEPQALWDNSSSLLTFFIRSGQVLPAGRQVTLSTLSGDFVLPVEYETDSPDLQVSARSFDNIDEIIVPTSVFQSSTVPHIHLFLYSELDYSNNMPYQMSDVDLYFTTNRPMYAGMIIYVRLSGFQSNLVEVPLLGATKSMFKDGLAIFNLPENILELEIVETIYSDESMFQITFQGLTMPAALYVNDSSLLIWNSDEGAAKQPIDNSPEVGGSNKTFIRSQIEFSPMTPRLAANVTFTILPSIVFYQGDSIVFHLYSFSCTSTQIPLIGPDAVKFQDQVAIWDQEGYTLIVIVAENQIIDNANPVKFTIGIDQNFRLPDKLSKNDGILRLEGVGATITAEPMKKTPAIGTSKDVIVSQIYFEPKDESINAIARISFSMILNTDVLPNSSIYIKLGGLVRDPPKTPTGVNAALRSGTIRLSGANAPLFVGEVGQWDQNNVLLTIKMISTVQIYAGDLIQFFIESDQYFRLPYSTYPNDPTFRLAIPEAGISERRFLSSTRVSQEGKSFATSIIFYGSAGSVAYPNTVVELNIHFQPNVDLPAGSVIIIRLPGFTCPTKKVPLAAQKMPVIGQLDISEILSYGYWDALAETFSLEVPRDQSLDRTALTVVRVMEYIGFRLPSTPLEPNDQRLTIRSTENNIIFEEPIKTSPRVVSRTFMISEFRYRPPKKQSIFQLQMILQPTVNITADNDIIVYLPQFSNSLSKVNVRFTGNDSFRIENSLGLWNETTAQLTFSVPFKSVIPAFTMLEFHIDESQGFILPPALRSNDPTLQISSVNNIKFEPIKVSPMVGNGPFKGHNYCMYQYEVGVRTSEPICLTAQTCYPPLTDPCSASELSRCGCKSRLDTIFPMKVSGFNLQQEEKIIFLPENTLCSLSAIGPDIFSPFKPASSQTLNADGSVITFDGISSIKTGRYRICIKDSGGIFDVGKVTVRPKCKAPLVQVGGVCVQTCPGTKIPVAGDCMRDQKAMVADPSQAYMFALKVDDPYASSGKALFSRPSNDADQRYFRYRFVYEIAKLLDADPSRFQIVSLGNGSVIVNTVIKPLPGYKEIMTSEERSPYGLITLLRALQADKSSVLYTSSFFQNIDPGWMPAPMAVRQCPDGVYRVLCPYSNTIYSASQSAIMFAVGTLLTPVVLAILCVAMWNVDRERSSGIDEPILEKLRKDYTQVEPKLQLEYAESWLEGRFPGENWQKARLAIKNIT
jgi:hypothetical protein